jgi:hypothetical protein
MQNGANYYRLKLMNTDGTTEYSEILVIENKISEDEFSFYPNPSTGIVNYSFSSLRNEDIRIEVLDMLGRVVKTENISVSAGKNTETLNISELNQGTYNLKITHSGSVEIRNAKIVKN